jgi:predicted nucleic acid-binding protein
MLLDTSGLMCLFDKRDIRHADATRHYSSANRRLTHNYVLSEFVALAMARRAPRSEALHFVEALVNSEEIEVIWVDRDLHDRSLDLLKQRDDKTWSLCDAVSFVTMKDRDILQALTTDHDFEQAGMVKLLAR